MKECNAIYVFDIVLFRSTNWKIHSMKRKHRSCCSIDYKYYLKYSNFVVMLVENIFSLIKYLKKRMKKQNIRPILWKKKLKPYEVLYCTAHFICQQKSTTQVFFRAKRKKFHFWFMEIPPYSYACCFFIPIVWIPWHWNVSKRSIHLVSCSFYLFVCLHLGIQTNILVLYWQ